MKPLPPRDAPRCLKCGVLLPMHVAGCPELRVPPAQRDELPGRPGYEVIDHSRFDEITEEKES